MHEDPNSVEILEDISEKEILDRLKIYMDVGQIDNDTALIQNKNKLIINTDVLVEDIHFSKQTTSPQDVGWKAIATNFSDLACSGVDEILGITIGLILPPSTSWKWVDDLYRGMNNALKKYGGKLLGGDISKGKEKVISITAIGTQGRLNLDRRNAKAGDFLVTSGSHGLSRLGLALLLSEPLPKCSTISEKLKRKAISAHKTPSAPIDPLKKLIYCKPHNLPWRAAGTDSSDGLLEAIYSLCISSDCAAVINKKNIPKDDEWPIGNEWDKWCLSGGEDYELVVSLPPEWAEKWIEIMPFSKIIGEMKKGIPRISWDDGLEIKKEDYLEFKHF